MIGRKLLISTGLFILISSAVPARSFLGDSFFDRFTVGVEWGYTQNLLQSRRYNFISEEGYRIFEDSFASQKKRGGYPPRFCIFLIFSF